MTHFTNEAQAERCGEHWLEKAKEVLLDTRSSPRFKAQRLKFYAQLADMCFTLRLEELDRHARELDPNY